jgi:hypothetical protein
VAENAAAALTLAAPMTNRWMALNSFSGCLPARRAIARRRA